MAFCSDGDGKLKYRETKLRKILKVVFTDKRAQEGDRCTKLTQAAGQIQEKKPFS